MLLVIRFLKCFLSNSLVLCPALAREAHLIPYLTLNLSHVLACAVILKVTSPGHVLSGIGLQRTCAVLDIGHHDKAIDTLPKEATRPV